MKRKASSSHDEAVIRELRNNPAFAVEYLKAALEDADSRKCCSSRCAVSPKPAAASPKLPRPPGIERESLYRALSAHGNPRLSTLVAVTKAVGLTLTVELAQSP
jgi:probable addiction module antidote protein